MTQKNLLAVASAAFLSLASAPFAFAQGITVEDAYLRVSGAMATSAAAFMVIENHGEDDRLIGASSDIAKKVELHTHVDAGNGVVEMKHVEDGFAIPKGETHALIRGGDHVMFMGLNKVPKEGDIVHLTLTFEKAGDVTVDVPVDNERAPEAAMDHSKMDHSKQDVDSSN
ncbi:copper chaperone PCu(A)C [Pseudorhodobacter sp.]|uniref:copper chaperone PCu(A)C n=1 Tax=Pseudorhodobacter sp. TaxID=1934400 RepID=UPI0026485DBE|nr:copper chaperone PCu(A)C [Pseudorhodobacter sp.]MDN5786706.1 copper chaperone PCu(A)C [Pseudorhodobacter sp.]